MDETVEFELNGKKYGCNRGFVWSIDEQGEEEYLGMFADIKLVEKTSQCAIFYLEYRDYSEYIVFDGEFFGDINDIHFAVIPIHKDKRSPVTGKMWEQVRIIIDNRDIINQIGYEDDFHWGIESSCFLIQKDEYYKGKLHIGICGCTAEGDDDIVVDVDNSENYVSWKIYHDRNHDIYDIFLFRKVDYKKALEEAINNITRKEEDVYKYYYLLSQSKSELVGKINGKISSITIEEDALAVVKKNGFLLRYVSPELKTIEVCLAAVRQNNWALQYVPEELQEELKRKFKKTS